MKKHIWDFRQYLSHNNSYDVFGIAETRLGPEVNDNIIQVAGYSVLRQDRNVRGGGILLYIKGNLKAKILYTCNTEHENKPLKPEYIFCSVWEGSSAPTLIFLIYLPPDVSIRSDRQLIKLLRSTSSDFSHKAVIGDWNANMLAPNNSDTRFVKDIMSELSLKLVPTGPSHHTTRFPKNKTNNAVSEDSIFSDADEMSDDDVLSVTDELSDDCELPDNNNFTKNKFSKNTWIDFCRRM